MILKFITNSPKMAEYAISCGVDRIFIDLEKVGKDERQGHLNTHLASHKVEDVINIRKYLPDAELLVRVNPIYHNSEVEIDRVVDAGADIVMLPMFTQKREVEKFIEYVKGRTQISLLLETPQALARVDHILKLAGNINEIHVGLNDLHLGMNLNFMFELLSGGIVEHLAEKITSNNIRFGFGGIARIGSGAIPAEYILGEHVRLDSEMVIISRSFHEQAESREDLKEINLEKEITRLRRCVQLWQDDSTESLKKNKKMLQEKITSFVNERRGPLEDKVPGRLTPTMSN